MPGPEVLAGARSQREAVGLAALALFRWYEQMGPGWDQLQVDQRSIPGVADWLRDVDRLHRALVKAALGPEAEEWLVAMVTAMTSHGAWRTLQGCGMDTTEAATTVARLVGNHEQRGGVH
jgi:hypothetical protein